MTAHSTICLIRAGRKVITATRWPSTDGFVDAVGNEDDRLAGRLPDTQEFAQKRLACLCIERSEGLVHQQNLGIVGEVARDRDALLHATG
ncbi:hypothetical protein [Bradyrhizobium sp. CSS354]|uniref:hypothetical protein n=1 Tax=Bradyrhizobium sp. CSS354 TaxID=2699172 RepID=UPI0023B01477|nr:hypothetical protein [Bradyrhizobium sp. CSS354]